MMMHRRLLETAVEPAATPADAANRTAEAELSQANFDTNMVIILAALLCALICALGLNSMVRCILRCSRRFGMETAEQTAARISGTGLKKSTLRKIPIFVYGSDHLGSGVEGECPICLGEFVDGDKVRVLPKCNHGFHVNCIDIWLESHSSCPNCRHSLVDSTDSSKSTPPSPLSPPTPPRDAVESDSRQEHMVVEISTFGT